MEKSRYTLTKGTHSLYNYCSVCGKRIALLKRVCSPECETIAKVLEQNTIIAAMQKTLKRQDHELKELYAAMREDLREKRQQKILSMSEPERILHQQTCGEEWRKHSWVHELVLGSRSWNFSKENNNA